ncbi:hypothetical protein EDD15DRAFT_2288257 [Pisolithus albus]|nr:hypothetical protein EDD15DRAFT_2288257 [Pisolithus albus]
MIHSDPGLPFRVDSIFHPSFPFSLLNASSRLSECSGTPMDDYQSTIYSTPRSCSASVQMGVNYESMTPNQGSHTMFTQLMASIKVNTALEIQLTSLKDESASLAVRLDTTEKIVTELRDLWHVCYVCIRVCFRGEQHHIAQETSKPDVCTYAELVIVGSVGKGGWTW